MSVRIIYAIASLCYADVNDFVFKQFRIEQR